MNILYNNENKYNNEIKYYNDKFILFKEKIKCIKKIKENDKLGLNDNKLYIDGYQWYRYLTRRFLGQNYINKSNIYIYR